MVTSAHGVFGERSRAGRTLRHPLQQPKEVAVVQLQRPAGGRRVQHLPGARAVSRQHACHWCLAGRAVAWRTPTVQPRGGLEGGAQVTAGAYVAHWKADTTMLGVGPEKSACGTPGCWRMPELM
jgi:hypothetical protein